MGLQHEQLAVHLGPKLKQNIGKHVSAGCLVFMPQCPDDDVVSSLSCPTTSRSILQDLLNHPVDTPDDIDEMLDFLLERASADYDRFLQYAEASKASSNESHWAMPTMAEKEDEESCRSLLEASHDEVDWWSRADSVHSRLLPSSLTRLRRCLLPLTVVFPLDENRSSSTIRVRRQSESLIEILLLSQQRSNVMYMLQNYQELLEEYGKTSQNADVTKSLKRLIDRAVKKARKQFSSPQKRKREAPSSTEDSPNICPVSSGESLTDGESVLTVGFTDTTFQESAARAIKSILRPNFEILSNESLLALDVRHTRREMIYQSLYPLQQKAPTIRNGAVAISFREMTESSFLEEKHFMDQVNASISRPFYPHSRPRLSMSTLSAKHLERIRDIFFDDNGSLREQVCSDVAINSEKHNYIAFKNENGGGSGDSRWQVPIGKHVTVQNGQKRLRRLNGVRRRVEEVLIAAGQLNPEIEDVVDMFLLVGGTVTQALHHDHGREFTEWYPEETFDEDGSPPPATMGWESDRLAYNMEMASSYAPSGSIFSMQSPSGGDPAPKVLLGVQSSNIVMLDSNACRITNGRAGEQFRVDRVENEHVVVVEAPIGVVFTGDFPHAGVRNIPDKTTVHDSMMDFFGKLSDRLSTEEHVDGASVLDVLCEHQNLNDFCRLYVSTEVRRSRIRIPRNTIGYSDCAVNGSR